MRAREGGAGEPSRRVGARVHVDPVGEDLGDLAGRVAVDNHLLEPAGRSQEIVTDPEKVGRGLPGEADPWIDAGVGEEVRRSLEGEAGDF